MFELHIPVTVYHEGKPAGIQRRNLEAGTEREAMEELTSLHDWLSYATQAHLPMGSTAHINHKSGKYHHRHAFRPI